MFGLLPQADSVTDLRRQASELGASRARVLAAADAERRRIERDLHDGAQQHLTSLSVRLLMAAKLAGQDPELASLLEQLGAEVRDTAQEVRNLAHGIYPPLLRANGLADALFAAASHATLPTRVLAGSVGRYPADVEAAVYFCCLEAMQNACKHAGERASIRLRVREEAGTLTFEVTDDGAGFDATGRGLGAGLLNMADRLGAFGGRLRVELAQHLPELDRQADDRLVLRLALGVDRVEQLRWRKATQYEVELPGQVGGVP